MPMKKKAKKDRKIQALITEEKHSRLTAIKDFYNASMNETINAALDDFIKREERRIKKAQKNETLPSTTNQARDEDPEEEGWWEAKALSATDPLPPLSQIKYILEQGGNGDIDPVAARKRLDLDRRKTALYAWEGWLRKTIPRELREENEKKLSINNIDS